MNVARGIAIVLALLVLRAVIGVTGSYVRRRAVACVLVNASSEEEAVRIGRTLLDEGLAAAVNLIPGVRSLYRWEGKAEDRPEVMMVIKTRPGCARRVVRRVGELHSYRVPSIFALPPALLTHGPYGDWIAEVTGGRPWWKGIRPEDILPTRAARRG